MYPVVEIHCSSVGSIFTVAREVFIHQKSCKDYKRAQTKPRYSRF